MTQDQFLLSWCQVEEEVAQPQEQKGPEKRAVGEEEGREGEWKEWIERRVGCWVKRGEVERWYVSGGRVRGWEGGRDDQ